MSRAYLARRMSQEEAREGPLGLYIIRQLQKRRREIDLDQRKDDKPRKYRNVGVV